MKDTILLFLFTGALLALCRLRWRTPVLPLAVFLCHLWSLSYFRFYAIGVIAAAAVGASITLWVSKFKVRRKARVAIVCVLAVTAACAYAAYNYYSEAIDALTGIATAVEQVDKSGYTFLRPAMTLDFVVQFIKAGIVYVLGPFAWVFHGVDWIGMLFYPGMYVTYIALPFVMIGCVQLWRSRKWGGYMILFCFLFHALIEILVYQAGERQRMMTDSIFVICAVLGWYHRAGYRRFIPATYAALAVFALAQIGGSVL